MNYPADFDSPTFPAGRSIASARVVGIVIMVVFFLIMVTTGMFIWAQKSIRIHPFLVSVNNITGQWDIVGHDHEQITQIPVAQSLQESALTKFVQYWFWASASDIANSARWRECDMASDCGLGIEKKGIDIEGDCAIYCLTGDDLYSGFMERILPEYNRLKTDGNTWMADMDSLVLTPIDSITPGGGVWQVRVNVIQNEQDTIQILGYAYIEKANDKYQKNLGYYIKKFNAYKLN